MVFGVLAVAVCCALAKPALADPPLPVFTGGTYNITTYGAATGNSATTNTTDIQAAINAATADPNGGTVEIPSGIFLSNQINLKSNVNLQLDSGAVLRDNSFGSTLISNNGASLSNVEISGTGIIDGNALTTAGGSKLINLTKCSTLEVKDVSVENAGNEHLVVETSNNVTINNVTIADPRTLAANNGNYLSNTDGIDYNGSNFLIENCNINDGDDDIVAKSGSGAVSNIVIKNDTIGAGHGISIGGGTSKGVNGMTITNCTLTGTTNGLRIKANDGNNSNGGGGAATPLQNVSYSGITMTNVTNPIVIESFYNGGDTFAPSPTSASFYPATPTAADAYTPFYENVSFSGITATGSTNGGIIQGLNTNPLSINGLTFTNVNITAGSYMEMWYGTNINVAGLTVKVPSTDPYYSASPVSGVYMYGLTNTTVPEPTSLGILGLGGLLFIRRKPRADR
ncbi:MAG: glycosyl hydrolase family 28 protein [Tepidisphaeraceae bacterium]